MNEHGEVSIIYLAGPPGAGKTSVAEGYIEQHHNTEQFGTGELVWGIRDGEIDSRYAHIIRDAAQEGTPLSAALFSEVMHERIMRIRDSTETVIVTGFPHGYQDWQMFNEAIEGSYVRAYGSVLLDANVVTSVSRMQERDVKKGMNRDTVTSPEEVSLYQKRYYSLMGRLAIRLDCYRQSGIEIVTISAENSPAQVLSDFSKTICMFQERKDRDE